MGPRIFIEGRSVLFNKAFDIPERSQLLITARIMEFIKTEAFIANEITQLTTADSKLSFKFFCASKQGPINVIAINQTDWEKVLKKLN
jgi:hypothetical protein